MMLEAYNKYRAAGFSCVPTSNLKSPAVPKGTKITGNWDNLKEYKSAHGIGLWCGDTLECIDLDNHFKDATSRLKALSHIPEVDEIFHKYDFVVQRTPSGGAHIIYRCPSVNGSAKLASRLNKEGKPDVLIETRGSGNYFCVDPTPGYKLQEGFGDIFNLPVITAEDRAILLDACRSFNEVVDIHRQSTATGVHDDWPGDIYDKSPESIPAMREALLGAGWTDIGEGNWRRPGKEKGISATLGIAGPGVFNCFTSNGHPFEIKTGYTAFQVVALLKYGGDFSAFATELAAVPEIEIGEIIADKTPCNGFIDGRSMNEWIEVAKTQKVPKMLFDKLWHEGEICFLFATTNLGKSSLAVQIGNSITKGEPIPGFEMTADRQRVLYIDFELSAKQLEKRYSLDYDIHYEFDAGFIRAKPDVLKADMASGMKYEDYLIRELIRYIIETGIKVIIIDNLTYLKGDVEQAKDALPFMKKINTIKETHGLSILLLAHTPKRNIYSPLTLNDMSGSSRLSQFCNSVFAIGKSVHEKSIRYIIQLKQQYTENIYGSDHVIVCELEQPLNFLQFTFKAYGDESDYIRGASEIERDNKKMAAKELAKEGKSLRKIGKELGVSYGTVKNMIDEKDEECPY